ncbi:MAG: hypothetical protein KJ017_03565 [Alphaproteobacteria bacterium]|nr:hypothetical protein [Alphaproteobacteria bacterium]
MMEFFMAVTGVAGAFLTTFMYWLMSTDKIEPKSVRFFAANALGAFMIMVSLVYHFDWGDLGGVVMELSWLIVSLIGLSKAIERPRKEKAIDHA